MEQEVKEKTKEYIKIKKNSDEVAVLKAAQALDKGKRELEKLKTLLIV